jgi:hypothetical protein
MENQNAAPVLLVGPVLPQHVSAAMGPSAAAKVELWIQQAGEALAAADMEHDVAWGVWYQGAWQAIALWVAAPEALAVLGAAVLAGKLDAFTTESSEG